MSESSQPDKVAVETAEEILAAIFGEDLKGCTFSLDEVAKVVNEALKKRTAEAEEIIELYEKVVEALHLLSSPPENAKTLDANELRSLLSQRLDSIRTLTTRTMQTTAMVKSKRAGGETSK